MIVTSSVTSVSPLVDSLTAIALDQPFPELYTEKTPVLDWAGAMGAKLLLWRPSTTRWHTTLFFQKRNASKAMLVRNQAYFQSEENAFSFKSFLFRF